LGGYIYIPISIPIPSWKFRVLPIPIPIPNQSGDSPSKRGRVRVIPTGTGLFAISNSVRAWTDLGSPFLAQASQARLGESGRGENLVLRDHLAQARGSGPERLVISLRRACLTQARIRACWRVILGTSRSGEGLSPRRDFECDLCSLEGLVTWTRWITILGERGSRPSEGELA